MVMGEGTGQGYMSLNLVLICLQATDQLVEKTMREGDLVGFIRCYLILSIKQVG